MNWANSPFVILWAPFAFVIAIVLIKQFFLYHANKLRSEERMAYLAKGLPLPPEPESERPTGPEARLRIAHGIRTGGIACVFTGIGLIAFSFALTWILHQHNVLAIAAAGLIPLAIGVGLLVDYQLRAKALPGQN
ncbi:MAG TPA: DUF6249 domain-containing protein [Acidobacteriaceae bacterium]|nr:DUF6249 domain-containing protein [Acidobacteriaceae bacterium]